MSDRKDVIPAQRIYSARVRHFTTCIVLPHVVALSGPFVLPPGWLSWYGVSLWLVMWVLVGGLGVSVGFHRHFAHGAFSASGPFRYLMGAAGSMAAQGPLLYWVSLHRRHHSFSDQAGDPHTPVTDARTRKSGLAAFRHGHVLWTLNHALPKPSRYAAELAADPMVRSINGNYRLFVLLVASRRGPFGHALASRRSCRG